MSKNNNRIAEIGAKVGDPARVAILAALIDGRALTAGELAMSAGVTAQTASGHLSRLIQTGLLAVEKQGRHRYYRLAGADIARMLEGLMQIASSTAPVTARKMSTGPRAVSMRYARTWYAHFAGERGVSITGRLTGPGFLGIGGERGLG